MRTRTLIGAAMALGLILPFSAARAAQSAATAADTLVRPDPDVVMGKLDNGLRFAIKQHPSHQREVIFFYVAAGSLDERDDERGLAHFLEHMAFNGSRNIPAGTLIKTFEDAGIAFGRDQNANTSYFGTTYTLDIPSEDDAKLSLAFRWLRDVGDGLLILPEQVNRERGVVMSEYRLTLGPQRDLSEAQQRFLTPGLRADDRTPIGDEAVVQHADAAKIAGFYHRWYRPENVTVVAVGDEPAAAVKARIEKAFAAWRNPTPQPPRAEPGAVDFARTSATLGLSDPHIGSEVEICRYGPKEPHQPEDVAITREHLADRIWAQVFHDRALRLARGDNPPFLEASGGYDVSFRVAGETCFSAAARSDDWRTALDVMTQEVRRLETYGVTDKEFDTARRAILVDAEAAVASGPTDAPDRIAAAVLDNLVRDDTFDTHEEERRVYGLAFAGLDAKAVNTAFHRRWTDASPPLVVAAGPESVAEAEIAKAYAGDLAKAAPAAPIDRANRAWAYAGFGQPGQVVKRETIAQPGFTRVTYANGVVLNVKRTGFAKDSVDVHVQFGAGQQETTPGQAIDAQIVGPLLVTGGLRRNDVEDLAALCKGRQCNVELDVGREAFDLNGATAPRDLDLELQIMTGLLSEPGFRPTMANAMPTLAETYYRSIRMSPEATASLTLDHALPGPHVADLPTQAHLAGLTAETFAALVKTPLTEDPLEVTLVGDVDEDAAIAAVGRTLGALPMRTGSGAPRTDAVRLHMSDAPPPRLVAYHEGPKDQAAVNLTWPLFVWTPERRREARVDLLMTHMLQDAVTERVRQKLGKSYSPGVSDTLPRGGDQGSLTMLIETSPDAVAAVEAEALDIVAGFAAGQITDDMLEQARKPILDDLAKERTYDGWWVKVMNGSERHPDKLASAGTDLAELSSIRLDEVKAEARRWLSARPYIVESLPKPPAETTAEAVLPKAEPGR